MVSKCHILFIIVNYYHFDKQGNNFPLLGVSSFNHGLVPLATTNSFSVSKWLPGFSSVAEGLETRSGNRWQQMRCRLSRPLITVLGLVVTEAS